MPTVRIRYLGSLQRTLGRVEEEIEFTPGTTTQALLSLLADRHGETWKKCFLTPEGKVRPSVQLILNDTMIMKPAELERPLEESCQLCLVIGIYPLEGGEAEGILWG